MTKSASATSYDLPLLSALLCVLVGWPFHGEWLILLALSPLFYWLMEPRRPAMPIFIGAGLVAIVYYLAISWPLLSLSWWGWGSASGGESSLFLLRQQAFIAVLMVVLSFWGAVLWGVCGWLMCRYAPAPVRAFWVLPCLMVVVVEWFGHWVLWGMSWGQLGYHLHGVPIIRQLASLAGVPGLSFFILFINATVAGLCRVWTSAAVTNALGRRRGRMTAHAALVWAQPAVRLMVCAASLVVLASVAYGFARNTSDDGKTRSLTVAVLQGNVATSASDDGSPDRLGGTYGPMVDQAMAGKADLIVLPETVWLRTLQLDDTPPRRDPGTPLVPREELGRIFAKRLAGTPAVVVLGIDTLSTGLIYNAMVFWSADGLMGTYFKRALVPFAEFRPRGLSWLAPQNQLHGSGFVYTPGRGAQLVTVHGVRVGSFICQEVMFPDVARHSVKDGAQILVTTGNDGVFEDARVARTLADMAILRAVEHERFLVRGMKTGISAIIDPQGRVLAEATANTSAILWHRIAPLETRSPYSQWGDWLVWACGFLVVMNCAARRPDTTEPQKFHSPPPRPDPDEGRGGRRSSSAGRGITETI